MEYSYYRDSRHHYLTIPCPEVENYQYRMLAANRMEMLVPCSIRNVDGKRYLYYDITARENMTEFFRGHGSAAQEIPRLLYAIADVGAVLERYLLDCSRMMLGPEFVFYDYTRGEFSFLYYPEDPEEASGPAFYEYLADHADPQDKMLYYTLLRLISISANRTFVLEEGFLTRALGRKRPENEPLADRAAGMPAGVQPDQPEGGAGNAAWGTIGARDGCAAYGRTQYGSSAYGEPAYAQMMNTASMSDRMESANGRKDADEFGMEDMDVSDVSEHKRFQVPLAVFVAVAVLLLAGAIGLACARLYIPMNETYDMAARYGMVACLAASILTAVYGGYRGMRSSRQELHGMREHARLERRNALTPVDDYR